MKYIFVNLKRFDVPQKYGGVCPVEDPKDWIEGIIDDSISYGLGNMEDVKLVFLLPESLIIPGMERLNSYARDNHSISIGCQGLYRQDISIGGNFGAFTTNLPAAAAFNMGCTTAIIGHLEERKDKLEIISRFDKSTIVDGEKRKKSIETVEEIINEELLCGLNRGLDILLCIGESQEEKEDVKRVLYSQLKNGLKGVEDYIEYRNIIIAYEPIWAIGPGKTPPDREYISFVSQFIKSTVRELFNFDIPVVYGGGLKEENASMLGNIDTIDGGLVALTRFTEDIGFYPEGLKNIISKYLNR